MGVDVMLAGNMGDGAKNVLQRNGIAVIRGCHGPVEEVVAAYLAGRIADSGDACAHHHEGGCPEHHGTTGSHLAEWQRKPVPTARSATLCGDLFYRSPLFFRKKPLSGKFFVFLPCRRVPFNGAAKPRCARMKRESGVTPEQFPLPR